jgi:hypothetical protein
VGLRSEFASAAPASPILPNNPFVVDWEMRESLDVAEHQKDRAKDVIHERPKTEWHAMLDELTKVRTGDEITVELLDAEFGDAFEAERMPLAYIEYDEGRR